MAAQSSILDLIFRTKRTGNEAKQVKAELDDLNRVNKQAGQLAQQASMGWLAVKGAVLGLGLAALAAVPGLVQLGIDVHRSEVALAAYTGSAENAADAIRQVQDAADGAISKLDASQNATRLFAMGLASTSEEAAKLTQIATTLGATMGKGPQQALEEFTLMLANQSILRLDTFGISGARVRTRMVELQQETRGLTRDMAFMMAVMEEGEGRLEALDAAGFQAASSIDRLNAMLQDAKIAAGTWLADGLVPALDGTLALKDAVEDQRLEVARASSSYEDYKRRLREMATTAIQAGRDGYKGWNPLLNTIGEVGGQAAAAGLMLDQMSEAEYNAFTAAQQTTVALSEQDQVLMQATAQIDAFANALAGSELSMEVVKASLNGKLGPAWDAYIDLQAEARQSHVDNQAALAELQVGTEKYEEALANAENDQDSYNKKLLEMEENLRKTTSQLIFQQAAVGLNAQQSLELGRALGLVDEKTYAVSSAAEKLRQFYDAQDGSLDGVIANTDNYVQAIGELNTSISELPEEQITEITVEDIAARLAVQEYENAVLNLPDGHDTLISAQTAAAISSLEEVMRTIFNIPTSKTVDLVVRSSYNVQAIQGMRGVPGYASGGEFQVAGPSGTDRIPVSFMATAGETVTVTPAGGGGPPSKGVQLIINFSPMMSFATADEVQHKLLPLIEGGIRRIVEQTRL